MSRFALALSIVLAAIAAPSCLAAPFGIDPIQTTVGFIGFALGLIVARGPSPSRSAIFSTAIGFAAICGLIAWLASVVAPWIARSWPLPAPELGTATSVFPWCGTALLFASSIALGSGSARMWRASCGEGRGGLAFLAVVAGSIVAALFCWRAIGPCGTLVLAGVLALAGASCGVVSERVEPSRDCGRAYFASAALGVLIGTLQAPFEIAAGGTLLAVVCGTVFASGGALAGALVRSSAERSPRAASLVAAISIATTAIVIASEFPSAQAIVFASARVAEGVGGVLPRFDMLHPLPLWLAIAGASALVLGALDSTRSIGIVIGLAAVVRSFPRDEHASAIAASFVVALVAAQAVASAFPARTRWRPYAALGLTCAWICAAIFVRRLDSFERDGARFEVDAGSSGDGSTRPLSIDAVPLPLAPPRLESVDRLLRSVLAWRDEPEACLVLGPGGAVWVERLLAASASRVDYVTPYAAEAQFVLAESTARPRLRTVAMPTRRFLAASTESYDLILICPAEPPWHRAGATLTAEFRELAIDRLTANGMAAQLFALSGMQPANVVFRLMGDAFLAVEDGVLIVDHPRSIDPQFALLFTRGPVRLAIDRVSSRIEQIRSASPHLGGPDFEIRGLVAGIFADTPVLRFSSRVFVSNRDERPWMAASLHARVIPDPLYVPSNLANLIGYHAFVESRIDGPAVGRNEFLSVARRDHEAVHHWLLRRAGAPEQFRADSDDPPATPFELEALVQCLAKSPTFVLFRAPILAAALRLDLERRRGEARALLDRAAAIEARATSDSKGVAECEPERPLALARAMLYSRHGLRTAAEAMLASIVEEAPNSTEAKRELAVLLAYGGRASRQRARELLRDTDLRHDSSAPVCDRWCVARRWVLEAVNAAPSDRSDAAARVRALPRRR